MRPRAPPWGVCSPHGAPPTLALVSTSRRPCRLQLSVQRKRGKPLRFLKNKQAGVGVEGRPVSGFQSQQLPADAPGKVAEDSVLGVLGPLPPAWETWRPGWSSWLQASAWLSPGRRRHSGGKAAGGRPQDLSLSLSAFQINKSGGGVGGGGTGKYARYHKTLL